MLLLASCAGAGQSGSSAPAASQGGTVPSAAASGSAAPDLGSVTVALGDSPTSDLFMAGTTTAPKLNVWAKRGLTVNAVTSGGAGKVTQLMAGGGADIGLTAGPGEAGAIAQGLEAKIVAGVFLPYNQNVIVSAKSDAKSFSDLKGKTFGVTSIGSGGYYATVKLAESEGWKLDQDIKVAPLGSLDALSAALSSGSIDVFIFGAQTAWQLEAKDIGRDMGSVADIVGPTVFEAIIASDKLIKERPDALKAYLDGYFEAVRYLRDNPDKFKQQLIDWEFDADIADKLAALDLKDLVPDGVIPDENLEGLAAAVPVIYPKVTAKPSIDSIVDTSFLPATGK
jgi:NitT/TauT family transport system substrate-binding protein